MDNDLYRKLKRQYDIKKQIAVDKANVKKKKIYEENPKLQEIEDQINGLALDITKKILNSDKITRQIEQENMSMKLSKLSDKLDSEFKKINIKKESLKPIFECETCQDTGFVTKDGQTKQCNCFLQALINETYKQSNVTKLEEENFSTFDIGFYAKTPNKQKYGIEKSPLENIEQIKNISYEFSKNIYKKDQKNLLFIGNTGLGKTFLANCIAAEVINSGKTVIYQTAPVLMDKIITYKFSYDKKDIEKDQYNKIFDVDLLIIDDLGTETMTNNKFTELFNIINTRLLRNKKIIISTNLTLNELYKQYDERVISRLIGNFTICKFVGDDIRLKKKRIN
ncbi:MAG: ATP-binding protein [Clostridia bacterium]